MNRTERRIQEHIANFGSSDSKVSGRAEQVMIRHYLGKATQALIEACASANPVVRYRAAWTLGVSKDPSAFDCLLALTDDPDEGVRYDAVLALGNLGDSRALDPLRRMARERDPSLPAIEALRELRRAKDSGGRASRN